MPAERLHAYAGMLMPTLARYMTRQPWTIGRDAHAADAARLMAQHGIRHLPVTEEGRLVGIISERDLRIAALVSLDEMHVDDVMTSDVCVASPNAPIDAIIAGMAERKLGSVVVTDLEGVVEGIFTTVDALAAFGDVLRRADC